jgi:hypothetical protein
LVAFTHDNGVNFIDFGGDGAAETPIKMRPRSYIDEDNMYVTTTIYGNQIAMQKFPSKNRVKHNWDSEEKVYFLSYFED